MMRKRMLDMLVLAAMLAACVGMGRLFSLPLANADGGGELSIRLSEGDYPATRTVTLSTSATTDLLAGGSAKRPRVACRNNSAFTIWIGSNAAGTSLSQIGFPVLSSETFKLWNTGAQWYGLADSSAGASVISVRCADSMANNY